MSDETVAPEHSDDDDFTRQAEGDSPGLVKELWEFLAHNKKWWLTPIVVFLLLTAGLIVLAGSGAAPFIYTLF